MPASDSPATASARVRIFLPTYRRNALLRRAIDSLLAQTVSDWVCELHNDDPNDPFPGKLVAELGDPRIGLVQHPRNLGGTATFNLFFKATAEPFYSLLEDDNWWEPDFLATLLETAAAHSDKVVFWANMKIWQELIDGSFQFTGRTVREATSGPTQLFDWGQRGQIQGAIHSNGAALFRSRTGDNFSIPAVPFSVVEMFRERLFPYPLVYLPRPLANFSVTIASARSQDHAEWAVLQTMLTATFLRHANYSSTQLEQIWNDARNARPPATAALIMAALAQSGHSHFPAQAKLIDWLRLMRGTLRRPIIFWKILLSPRLHADWWTWLDYHTARCFQSSKTAGSSHGN